MNNPGAPPRSELARLRRAAGLTQRQIADALGLRSVRAVTAWENGAYAPSVNYVLPLARVLGVSAEVVVEAVAGPDQGLVGEPRAGIACDLSQSRSRGGAGGRTVQPPGRVDGAQPDVLRPETIEELAYHVAELARVVRQLQEAQEMGPWQDTDVGNKKDRTSA